VRVYIKSLFMLTVNLACSVLSLSTFLLEYFKTRKIRLKSIYTYSSRHTHFWRLVFYLRSLHFTANDVMIMISEYYKIACAKTN